MAVTSRGERNYPKAEWLVCASLMITVGTTELTVQSSAATVSGWMSVTTAPHMTIPRARKFTDRGGRIVRNTITAFGCGSAP